MAEIKERVISHDEACMLVKKLANHDTANYLIREVLMDRGLSAYEATEIITEVMRTHHEKSSNIITDNLGLILMLLAIVALVLYVLVNSVN